MAYCQTVWTDAACTARAYIELSWFTYSLKGRVSRPRPKLEHPIVYSLVSLYTHNSIYCSGTEEGGEEIDGREQESPMELTVVNSQYSVVQAVPAETTELNGQYSLVSREPNETTTAEPTAQYSVVQKEPKQTTEPSGQYSLVQAGPNETTDAQYSVVQTRPKKTKEAPVQLEPLQTTESNRHCSTVQEPLQADQVRGIQFCFSQMTCNLKIPTLHRYDRNYSFSYISYSTIQVTT